MYHGIVNVYKEKGYTSFDVVARMRGIFGQRKIGHTGTLDPDAEGVLPVCLGCATKACGMLTDRDKEYRAVMLLGVETDTQDMSGNVLARRETAHLSEDAVQRAVLSYIGEIEQIPPMYSAVKVNGKRLYELARKGVRVERKARRVRICAITVTAVCLPEVEMTVRCSKGTYIRTLCHDIGQTLGCGAAMKELTRTKASGFDIEESVTLAQLQQLKEQGQLARAVFPLADIFAAFPALTVGEAYVKLLRNGNALPECGFLDPLPKEPKGEVRVYEPGGRFLAVYRHVPERSCFVPVKMFLEE